MEIESKTGVAVEPWLTPSPSYPSAVRFGTPNQRWATIMNTHYFSMRTREALLVVFVRTRPYKKQADREPCKETSDMYSVLTMAVFEDSRGLELDVDDGELGRHSGG